MRLLPMLLVLACASPVAAQPRIGLAPYATLIAGEAADLVTTKVAQHQGAREGNPLLGQLGPAGMASKAATTAAVALLMRYWVSHGHTRLARVVGYTGGISSSVVAAHNLTVR